MLFRLAADMTLFLHVSFVFFVVIGLILIIVGRFRHWAWIRNLWFRVFHLLSIVLVVVQSWFGVICPLTNLEMILRSRAGEATYPGAFMAHWLDSFLYYQGPAWVFALCYTIFGALVVGSWLWVPPGRSSKLQNFLIET